MEDLEHPSAALDEGCESSLLALKISEFLSELWKMSACGPVSIMRLAVALRGRLVTKGLASSTGRLRASQASRQFYQLARSIEGLRDLSGVARSESAAYSQILSLVAAHENCHPIRVAAVLAWLFDGWDDFIAAYNDQRSPSTLDIESQVGGSGGRAERENLAMLVQAGASVSEAARRCGVQVATGQAWLVQQGVTVPKRPSVLKGDAREQAIESLGKGADKSTVCERTGWSPSSIERLLRTELGLKVAWKEARYRRDRDDARERWLIALKESGGNTKMARVVAKNVYAWLYRNDRVWLLDANRTVRKPKTASGLRVDWVRRDLELLDAARCAVDSILREGAETPVSLVEVFRRVPALKAKFRRVHDLPRTQQFLESVKRAKKSGLLDGEETQT